MNWRLARPTFGRGGKGRSHLTVVSTTRSLAARWKGRTQASTNLTCESPQQEITYVPTSVLKGGETTTDQELQVVRNNAISSYCLLHLWSFFFLLFLQQPTAWAKITSFCLSCIFTHTPWARPRRGIQRRLRYPQKHRNPNSNRLEIPFTQPNSEIPTHRAFPSSFEVPLRGCRQRQWGTNLQAPAEMPRPTCLQFLKPPTGVTTGWTPKAFTRSWFGFQRRSPSPDHSSFKNKSSGNLSLVPTSEMEQSTTSIQMLTDSPADVGAKRAKERWPKNNNNKNSRSLPMVRRFEGGSGHSGRPRPVAWGPTPTHGFTTPPALQPVEQAPTTYHEQATTDAQAASRTVGTKRPRESLAVKKKQERKAAKTLSAILLAFIITWTPYSVLVVVNAILGKELADIYIPEILWQFSYYLCYINFNSQPVLYALCNAAFRANVRQDPDL